jgi:hypothetical protein
VFLRFSRYRFRDGAEADGFEILRRHAAVVAAAPGCENAWLAQGQHPSTEFILVALFRDEPSLKSFEGRLRSDPTLSGDSFALLRLTRQPPEMTEYEVRSIE